MRFEFDASERREPPSNRFREIELRSFLSAQNILEDEAQLGLHRPTVPGRANAQLLPQHGIELRIVSVLMPAL